MAQFNSDDLFALFNVKTRDSELYFNHIAIDSRLLISPPDTCFVAVVGDRFDGHDFIEDVVRDGVKVVVVEREIPGVEVEQIVVPSTRKALADMAKYWREKALGSCLRIGVTGSSGKTTFKEWISIAVAGNPQFYTSPKSFNSSIGLPLSVLDTSSNAQQALYEVGISDPNEMDLQREILNPKLGILLNIGKAHLHRFKSEQDLFEEKWKLFRKVEKVIVEKELLEKFKGSHPGGFLWSMEDQSANLFFAKKSSERVFQVYHNGEALGELNLNHLEEVLLKTALSAVALLVYLGVPMTKIAKAVRLWKPISMRLEWIEGRNGNVLFNDTYNFDLSNFEVNLAQWDGKSLDKQKVLVLSDAGEGEWELASLLGAIRNLRNTEVFLVGKNWNKEFLGLQNVTHFSDADDCLRAFQQRDMFNTSFFIKGARMYRLERLTAFLINNQETFLEVNLMSIIKNYQFFKRKLNFRTKVLAMVKADGYGLGAVEIAKSLVYNHVDYLGVAYPNEGVELRKAGVNIPILVLNSGPSNFQELVEWNLEPTIFSHKNLNRLIRFLKRENRKMNVHIALETGMNRLGFSETELDEVVELWDANFVALKGMYSHLAASEDSSLDDFTMAQVHRFEAMAQKLESIQEKGTIKHILNSQGILRHSVFQFDMVRLGIGLFGIGNERLKPVVAWRTRVSQIKGVAKTESVGYGREGRLANDGKIAILPVGYADGFNRRLGNGVGEVWINGQRAKVIGNVCMDMIMLDISMVDCHEGDEVELLGPHISIQEWSEKLGTIPYEILTSLSNRNPRRFIEEMS